MIMKQLSIHLLQNEHKCIPVDGICKRIIKQIKTQKED